MGSYREPFCFVSTMFLSAVSAVKEPNGTCQCLSKSAHGKRNQCLTQFSREIGELHTFAALNSNDCTFLQASTHTHTHTALLTLNNPHRVFHGLGHGRKPLTVYCLTEKIFIILASLRCHPICFRIDFWNYFNYLQGIAWQSPRVPHRAFQTTVSVMMSVLIRAAPSN